MGRSEPATFSEPASADGVSLLERNRTWAGERRQPMAGKTPGVLWIGCADADHCEHEIVAARPGELQLLRNPGNLVNPLDLAGLAVLQHAVAVCKVREIVVVGHERCAAVAAALQGSCDCSPGSHWLAPLREVRSRHEALVEGGSAAARIALLARLNVVEQVIRLSESPVVSQAWEAGQRLTLRGWLFSETDARLRDTGVVVDGRRRPSDIRSAALQRLPAASAVAEEPRDNGGNAAFIEPLTRREQEILRHLGSGASNGHIAQRLNISRNTVASHLRSIYQKTGFTSRMEAVLTARRQQEYGA